MSQDGAGAGKSTEIMKRVLKTTVIKADPEKMRRPESKGHDEDPFINTYEQYSIIKPPFDLFTLATMPEICSELTPSLDAMAVNIEKMGHRISAREGIADHNKKVPPDVQTEISTAKNFFEHCVLDMDDVDFTELRARCRKDLETTGNAYIEVIPSANDSYRPAGLKHLPSWTMRLRKQDVVSTPYDVSRAMQVSYGKWSMKKFPTSKKFRRFVQIRESGIDPVFFKEWGDPRDINSKTGLADDNISESNRAHEVIHLKLYSSRSPYGLPRTIGHLFAMYGGRAAEEINYMTFENNQIPALALLATNVAVTDGSIDRMQEFIEERIQGNKNYATILLVEAEPVGEGMRDPGAMKLELKPLTEFQHAEAMFQSYIKMNNDSVRRAFRLPPIFTGLAEDYNRAVAEASRKLAEEQIFIPERRTVDSIFTLTLIARLGLASVVFKSNTPNVTDNFELTQLLATAELSGGLTPRISNKIVADVLSEELPEVAEEINPDIPFSLTKERERARLKAGLESVEKRLQNPMLFTTISAIVQKDISEPFLEPAQRASIAQLLLQLSDLTE